MRRHIVWEQTKIANCLFALLNELESSVDVRLASLASHGSRFVESCHWDFCCTSLIIRLCGLCERLYHESKINSTSCLHCLILRSIHDSWPKKPGSWFTFINRIERDSSRRWWELNRCSSIVLKMSCSDLNFVQKPSWSRQRTIPSWLLLFLLHFVRKLLLTKGWNWLLSLLLNLCLDLLIIPGLWLLHDLLAMSEWIACYTCIDGLFVDIKLIVWTHGVSVKALIGLLRNGVKVTCLTFGKTLL